MTETQVGVYFTNAVKHQSYSEQLTVFVGIHFMKEVSYCNLWKMMATRTTGTKVPLWNKSLIHRRNKYCINTACTRILSICCIMDIDTSLPETQGQASAGDMLVDELRLEN